MSVTKRKTGKTTKADASRSAVVRTKLADVASKMNPSTRDALGLDKPLTDDDVRLIDDVTAPPERKPFDPPPGRLAYVDNYGVHAGISIQTYACGCSVVGVGNLPDPVRIDWCSTHAAAVPERAGTVALADALDALAGRLNRTPPCSGREAFGGKSCITHLTGTGKRQPWPTLNPDRMCGACAALWHVTAAAQQLRTVATVEREVAAERDEPDPSALTPEARREADYRAAFVRAAEAAQQRGKRVEVWRHDGLYGRPGGDIRGTGAYRQVTIADPSAADYLAGKRDEPLESTGWVFLGFADPNGKCAPRSAAPTT